MTSAQLAMKRQPLTTLIALLALSPAGLLAQGSFGGGGAGQVSGVGGSYSGPEDTVPGAPTGGGTEPPTVGGGGDPFFPGGVRGFGATGAGRFTGGSNGGGSGGAGVPLPPGAESVVSSVDWTAWELWWAYNQHAYLDLRAHLFGDPVLTGSDDFFLGHGEEQVGTRSLRPTTTGMRDEVLPLLIEVLRAETSTTMEASALLALGKLASFTGDSKVALEAIKPFLTHSNQSVRERAIAALGILGREQSIDLVASLAAGDTLRLRDKYWIIFGDKVPYRTRAFATYALGLIGEASPSYHRVRVVNSLTGKSFRQALTLPTQDVAVAAVMALGLVPLPIDKSDTDGAGKLTVMLASRQHQIRWLLALFDERETPREVRAQIPIVLARLLQGTDGNSSLRRATVMRMLDVLEDRQSGREMRQSAVTALGRLADADEDDLDQEVRKVLKRASEKDADQVARRFATIALGEVGGRPGRGKGESTAGTRDIRRYLARNLGRGTSQTRPWSGLALGILERSMVDHGHESSTDMLEALRNAFKRAKSPSEAAAMGLACGLARDIAAEKALMAKLASGADRTTRSYAALALGLAGAEGAREQLRETLISSRFQAVMLRACAIALTLLDDEAAVPLLLAELERSSSVSSQAPVVTALGIVGDSRAIGPLVALAAGNDATQLARAAALTALGRLAERHLLPWNSGLAMRVNYTANPLTLTAPLLGGGVLDLP